MKINQNLLNIIGGIFPLISCQTLTLYNLDNRPYRDAPHPKYGVLLNNTKIQFLPDEFTFCLTFFYEFGLPSIFLQLDWLHFEYDAVRSFINSFVHYVSMVPY